MLKSLADKALNGRKPEILDGISLTITAELDCYVATLWANNDMPILITMGADTEEGRKK